MTAAVETEGLTKRYGSTVGIEDLDLTIERGEVFGFLGPNGAGKTTTIRCLVDLIRPTSGQARVLGYDTRAEAREVRSRIGYLPGELALWGEATGREVVEHLSRVRGTELRPDVVERLVDRLGASMETPIEDLSSGNKQKIGLVQALMAEPEVAILDEPTRGLDPLVQREILDLVARARDEGRTVFFSSHVLHEVEQVCDRVAIVRGGRLVAVEDVDELIHQGARNVDALFAEPVPEGSFEGLEGLRQLEVDDRRARLTFTGPIQPLLEAITQHEVVDLRIRDPTLEDAFLSYYDDREEDARGP